MTFAVSKSSGHPNTLQGLSSLDSDYLIQILNHELYLADASASCLFASAAADSNDGGSSCGGGCFG